MIPDGYNGAIVCWSTMSSNPIEGIVAQRLDSLGNLMWGDSGIVVSPFVETDFDICPDGEGGFFLAVSPDEGAAEFSDLFMQHIDAGGNILWGPNGILISGLASHSERYPKAAYCDLGGAFVVWEDHRAPYSTLGGLFAQRVSDSGTIMWNEDLDLDAEGVYFHQMISDGAGGFLLHTDPGGADYNTVYRVSSSGNILWQRYQVSSGAGADILPGDNFYYYLGFYGAQGTSYFAQKMDLNGNTYWPTFGSLQGALLCYFHPPNNIYGQDDYTYSTPFFYGIICYRYLNNYPRFYLGQKLDENGERVWGEHGVLMTSIDDGQLINTNAVHDGFGGVVVVFEKYPEYDIYAKRLDYAGRLGGALHLLVDLEAENPPVQIPLGGGRFHFDIAIEDTYSVSGIFDGWIEATLPNGQDLEILHRDNINIPANFIIQRPNMTQAVPANAPAGNYIYHLYIGNREYDDVWAEDSFEFVKMGGDFIPNDEFNDWTLTGFFEEKDSKTEEIKEQYKRQLNFSVKPNPFNPETCLSFNLPDAGYASLVIYDLQGREVVKLLEGFKSAGIYEITFNGAGLASGIYFVRLDAGQHHAALKLLLLK